MRLKLKCRETFTVKADVCFTTYSPVLSYSETAVLIATKPKSKPHDLEISLLFDKTDLLFFPLEGSSFNLSKYCPKSISVQETPSVSKRGEDSRHF